MILCTHCFKPRINCDCEDDSGFPPKIVCLIGSSRFFQQFQEANYQETMDGKIVLSLGFYPHSNVHHESQGCTPEQKIKLDELHKRKIEMADEVLVLNVDGYIGDSTKSELLHALRLSKKVRYLERSTHHPECNSRRTDPGKRYCTCWRSIVEVCRYEQHLQEVLS